MLFSTVANQVDQCLFMMFITIVNELHTVFGGVTFISGIAIYPGGII